MQENSGQPPDILSGCLILHVLRVSYSSLCSCRPAENFQNKQRHLTSSITAHSQNSSIAPARDVQSLWFFKLKPMLVPIFIVITRTRPSHTQYLNHAAGKMLKSVAHQTRPDHGRCAASKAGGRRKCTAHDGRNVSRKTKNEG